MIQASREELAYQIGRDAAEYFHEIFSKRKDCKTAAEIVAKEIVLIDLKTGIEFKPRCVVTPVQPVFADVKPNFRIRDIVGCAAFVAVLIIGINFLGAIAPDVHHWIGR